MTEREKALTCLKRRVCLWNENLFHDFSSDSRQPTANKKLNWMKHKTKLEEKK